MRLSVYVVRREPGDYFRWSSCFDNIAEALKDALRLAGHEVVPHDDAVPGRFIVFGTANYGGSLPDDAVIFNAEQLAVTMQFSQRLQNHLVWDYSRLNAEWLRGHGSRVSLCPIGYVPSMETVGKSVLQDVDVLFYGSINDRRHEILKELDDAGLRTKTIINVYGRDLDAWISRSKVVLNIHYYEDAVFEIFRCSHLFANGKAVVSESGGADAELEVLARRCAVVAGRDKIAETCKMLCRDSARRREAEERGYEEFKRVSFVESARKAAATL